MDSPGWHKGDAINTMHEGFYQYGDWARVVSPAFFSYPVSGVSEGFEGFHASIMDQFGSKRNRLKTLEEGVRIP